MQPIGTREMEDRRRPLATSHGPRAVPAHARRHVLIVDEESEFAAVAAGWCRSSGWKVSVAVDGINALDILSGTRTDLLVTALQIPGMNGWELLRHVRLRWHYDLEPPYRPPRVIVVSRRIEEEVQRFVRQLGADAFLPKPVSRATLLNTVAALFPRARPPQGRTMPGGHGPARRRVPVSAG